jgi:hypothetical protein
MLGQFMDFIDERGVIRRIVLAIAIWMTWAVSQWAMWYAVGNARDGMEIATIIAAVTAPVTAFAGYVFKAYIESRNP